MTLYGPDGRTIGPVPRPAMEARVNAELQSQFDRHLFILWVPTAFFNQRTQEFEGRYALASRWPEVDPRWQWVRESKHDPADTYDILGWYTTNMQDASATPEDPEGMKQVVFKTLSEMDNTRQSWKTRMKQTIEHNEAVKARRKEFAGELMAEAVKSTRGIKRGAKITTSDPQRYNFGSLSSEIEEALKEA